MGKMALLRPKKIETNRSQLRQRQRSVLRKAKGATIVIVTGPEEEDEKCVLDRSYFEEILKHLQSALETLEITTDTRLFSQLLRTAGTIDKDIRRGRVHSFEEAFGEK